MTTIRRIHISPPLINSSCAWSSELHELQALFDSPHTGAVTTRTTTLLGFIETSEHTVAFTRDTRSSLNSYGYSPHPLATYIKDVHTILTNAPLGSTKPIILSITSSSPSSITSMMDAIQELRTKLQDSQGPISRVAIELNTSCPNIKGSPPPAYTVARLAPILSALASYFWRDRTLAIGLKLPPYVYATQFDELIEIVASFSRPDPSDKTCRLNPFAFFTSTNTLGNSLLFSDQALWSKHIQESRDNGDGGDIDADGILANARTFSLPTVLGGLAGEAIHSLSLGNVYSLTRALGEHEDESIRAIIVIGVGGVTTKEAHRRMRQAGARVVACATILGREGVKAFESVSLTDEEVMA